MFSARHVIKMMTRISLLIMILSATVFGQGLTSVTGRVLDPSGAIIPGVTVTITNVATRAAREVLTNEQGVYTATQLAPGTYSVKAELPGFKPKIANDVPLPVNETVTLNLVLEVGVVSEAVDVVATTEAVNTVNSQLGVAFDQKKILELPLNARNIVDLLGLQTGVSVNTATSSLQLDANGNPVQSHDAGFVNGARNDQQNIVLDGVDNNQQQAGGAFTGALPTTLDSVQEFIVQTAGQTASNGRSSGAQVQLVTKSGSNDFHGSAYETYRSRGTSAANYFAPVNSATGKREAAGLIRHIPGGSVGGPVIKDKLFFFAAFERHTDRSQQLTTRTVPTPEFLNGQVRYLRKTQFQASEGKYGAITDGCGGMLEQISLIPCDTWNKTLLGGYFEAYRPYSTDIGHTTAGSDGGANLLSYSFNAPFTLNQNIYISRWDYVINSKNTVYVRGTLNNQGQTLGAETFPGANNARIYFDNSKGFAASWNSVLSSTVNNNVTLGLSRQSNNLTGAAAASYSFDGPSSFVQTTGASRQAINTWNFVDNLSWIKGNHNWQAGINSGFVNNYVLSYAVANPPAFSAAANLSYGDFGSNANTPLHRALGDAEFATVSNPLQAADAILSATGSFDLFNVGLQFDTQGNLLPQGAPFTRTIGLNQYDLYLQDSWKAKPNFTLNYGIHWGIVTPPWEKNGLEVNWAQNLGQRLRQQAGTPLNQSQLPTYSTQLAGRANNLPDYYVPALNNWAPRASFAYSPEIKEGVLGAIATKGGQLVIRGGYALTFDHTGGRFAYDAATSAGVGLLTKYAGQNAGFSIDGQGVPRAPRVAGSASNLILPYQSWPVPVSQSFIATGANGGWGSTTTTGIDRGIRPPSNHLVNFTLSKELPGQWVVEGSYVGRFARDLLGQVDLASPPNLIDTQSGQDYYSAMKQLMEQYEYNSVGAAAITGVGGITAANVLAATASIQPIPWFENAYGGFKQWAQTSAQGFSGVNFNSATQAFYAVLNKGLVPGPNAPVVITNNIEFYELAQALHILTTGQSQYFGMFTNISRSNYNSAQLTVRKRFSQGYTFTGNYTFSKSLDTTSQGESAGNRPGGTNSEGQIIDPYHPNRQYARSDFNRAHQFNGNAVIELPFGTGKLIGGNAGRVLNQVIGGWQVSGVAQSASGRPWSYTASSRYSMHYFGRDLPIPTGPIPNDLTKTSDASGKPLVFMLPGSNAQRATDGTMFRTPYPGSDSFARNTAAGPSYFNFDAAVSKRIQISEKVSSIFRAEAFNVLNHPNFALPTNTDVDKASNGLLGQITTTQGTERVMQFSYRLTF
jgi:hypothetical protein